MTLVASTESRRQAASAGSSRPSAPSRSSVAAASKRPCAERFAAAPFSACAAVRMPFGVAAVDRGLDRGEPHGTVVEKQLERRR